MVLEIMSLLSSDDWFKLGLGGQFKYMISLLSSVVQCVAEGGESLRVRLRSIYQTPTTTTSTTTISTTTTRTATTGTTAASTTTTSTSSEEKVEVVNTTQESFGGILRA